MKTGRLIHTDGLGNLLIYGDFLSVNNLFDALAVGCFLGNLNRYCNRLIIVLFTDCQRDQLLNFPADFLRLGRSGGDSAVIQQVRDLIAQQCFTLRRSSSQFSISVSHLSSILPL